jgi:hypothetical protein
MRILSSKIFLDCVFSLCGCGSDDAHVRMECAGCDTSLRNNAGLTAMDLAQQLKRHSVLAVLHQVGVSVDVSSPTAFRQPGADGAGQGANNQKDNPSGSRDTSSPRGKRSKSKEEQAAKRAQKEAARSGRKSARSNKKGSKSPRTQDEGQGRKGTGVDDHVGSTILL